MDLQVKVTGLKEVIESLETFCSPKLTQKIVQGSVRAAATVVKKEAVSLLGKGSGYIGTGVPKKRYWSGVTAAAMSIGILKKHWTEIFTEYGKGRPRFTKGRKGKKVVYRGLSRIARPFLRPAIITKQQAALDRMREFLETTFKAIFQLKQRDIQIPPDDLL